MEERLYLISMGRLLILQFILVWLHGTRLSWDCVCGVELVGCPDVSAVGCMVNGSRRSFGRMFLNMDVAENALSVGTGT